MIEWILNNWVIIIVGLVWIFSVRSQTAYRLKKKATLEDKIRALEWRRALKEEIDRLQIGKVAYNLPDIMKVGIEEKVEVTISRDVNADLVTSLKGRGIPKIEEMKISEFMKVQISGKDFDIVSLNEEKQMILATECAKWAWDVTPKKRGTFFITAKRKKSIKKKPGLWGVL